MMASWPADPSKGTILNLSAFQIHVPILRPKLVYKGKPLFGTVGLPSPTVLIEKLRSKKMHEQLDHGLLRVINLCNSYTMVPRTSLRLVLGAFIACCTAFGPAVPLVASKTMAPIASATCRGGFSPRGVWPVFSTSSPTPPSPTTPLSQRHLSVSL